MPQPLLVVVALLFLRRIDLVAAVDVDVKAAEVADDENIWCAILLAIVGS